MTATLPQTGFTDAAFQQFLSARVEPDWLRNRRESAWGQFGSTDWPTSREEEWMRTDIRMFHLDKFRTPGDSVGDVAAPALLSHGVDLGGHMRSVDSLCLDEGLSDDLAAKGVLFGDMGRLMADHGDRLRPYFERELLNPAQDRFASLNSAFWSGGTLLFVPRGVCIEQPLHALSAATAGGSDFNRTMVILEEGAEATLLTETASAEADTPGLHCGGVEVFVGDAAKLRYVTLQNWSTGMWHFAHQRASIGRGGRLQWTVGALGSRLAKVNQEVVLDGPDAEAQVNGVMFTQGKQHLSYNTRQRHRAPYCRSDLLYKTALQDRSRTVWRGMIQVDKPAQRTDAYQRNDNLMLAPTARADSIPGLEIEADDVRCTHGSTSGRVDRDQIFYAMTRGYTRTEAVRMIVTGFFQQVFDRITIESVRDALSEAIGRRVRDIPLN